MSARVASAEKRYRISLLLDAYGELLTGKQQDFLRRYYEEDFSFGEIAQDYNVSRQAIFDSVKHGEAALEDYERVLGLVAARKSGGPGSAGQSGPAFGSRAAGLAERMRSWLRRFGADSGGSGGRAELELLAEELESLSADLQTARGGMGEANGSGEGSMDLVNETAPGAARGALLVGDGPEVD